MEGKAYIYNTQIYQVVHSSTSLSPGRNAAQVFSAGHPHTPHSARTLRIHDRRSLLGVCPQPANPEEKEDG